MKISTKFFVALFMVSFAFTAQAQDLVWPLDSASMVEAQFDGGLNGWTTVGISDEDAVFVWEADGMADNGAYAGGAPIQSPSVANGAVVFDSDFYDNGGVPGDFGLGIAPANQATELISPIIDLTGVGAMTLEFNQYLRQFATTFSVAYSTDGGDTWSENIEFNSEFAGNQASDPAMVQSIPLFGAVGSPQFRFKFILDANYYFITIDDVRLINRLPHDLQVNENFFAIAPMYAVPVSQVQEFGFLADITNQGGSDETNVVLNMTIDGPNTTAVYSGDNNYGTVISDTIIENIPFGGYTPNDGVGLYSAAYTISADDEDLDPSNNVRTFEFAVTENTFSKEPAPTRSVLINPDDAWTADENHQWAYGTQYRVINSTNADGQDLIISSITFSIAPDAGAAGQVLDLRVYEFLGDDDEDGNISSTERVPVAFGIYEILGSETFSDLITVEVTDLFQSSPALKANTDYLVMLEYRATNAENCAFGAATMEYGAADFNAAEQGIVSYDQIIAFGGDINDMDYSLNGFASLVPVARMNIDFVNSNKEVLLPENTVAITPNPASDIANVALSFEDAMETVNLSIIDITGKVVRQATYQNVTAKQVSLDINELPAGTYMLNITTEAGQLTKRLIKQ